MQISVHLGRHDHHRPIFLQQHTVEGIVSKDTLRHQFLFERLPLIYEPCLLAHLPPRPSKNADLAHGLLASAFWSPFSTVTRC